MFSSRSSLFGMCLVVGLGALAMQTGCDSDPPMMTPQADLGVAPKPDSQPPVTPEDTYRLTIVGPASITMTVGEQATLRVGYMKNETNLPDKTIAFALKGDAKHAVLSTFTATTDALGVAQTTLAAGDLPGMFQVEASASLATPVTFYINVVAAPPPVTKLAGTFTLVSNFDIVTQFSGSTLGTVLNELEEMSNHPDDPGRYVVDIVFEQAFKNIDPSMQSALNFFKPLAYQQVQSLLMTYMNSLVTDLKGLAKSLSDLARRFQVTSSLISAGEQPTDKMMVVSHKLEKIGWTLNGKTKQYGYADLGLKSPQVDAVPLVLGSSTLQISEHSFPLQLGAFILVGLNELVIPALNPKASSFAGLMAGWVDCTAVGSTIFKTVNLFTEAFWASACDMALTAVGGVVEQQVTKINIGTTNLSLAGTCQITDANSDQYLDTIQSGLWTGTFSLAGNVAPINGVLNNFTGSRTK